METPSQAPPSAPPSPTDTTTAPEIPADLPASARPLFRLFTAFLAKGVSPDLALSQARETLGPTAARILTPEEFAAVVGRDLKTVLRWQRQGDVPGVRAKGPKGRKQLVGFHLETALKALQK